MNCYLFRFESKYETIIRVNHRTVKRKLLIIRLVIESMYRSSSCTSVINSNDGSRCKNFICKTRVRLRTHACWSCLVHSWYGHVVETINADTGMQVYIYMHGKGEGDSVNYSSLWFPYPLGGPRGSISDFSSLPFRPHASQNWHCYDSSIDTMRTIESSSRR